MRLASALSLAPGLCAAALLALAPATPVDAQQGSANPVVRMQSRGTDGDGKFYAVRCANDARGDVQTAFATDQICAVPRGGQARCSKDWTLREAGQYVCDAS